MLALQESVARRIEAAVQGRHQRLAVFGKDARQDLIGRCRNAVVQPVDGAEGLGAVGLAGKVVMFEDAQAADVDRLHEALLAFAEGLFGQEAGERDGQVIGEALPEKDFLRGEESGALVVELKQADALLAGI